MFKQAEARRDLTKPLDQIFLHYNRQKGYAVDLLSKFKVGVNCYPSMDLTVIGTLPIALLPLSSP